MDKQVSLNKHQAQQIAQVVYRDIKKFIDEHQEDFEKFLSESVIKRTSK